MDGGRLEDAMPGLMGAPMDGRLMPGDMGGRAPMGLDTPDPYMPGLGMGWLGVVHL